MRRLLPALLLAGAMPFATGALALDQAPPPAGDKAFGEAVRAYLLANPEVIQDALNALEQRRTEAERVASADALRSVGEPLFSGPDAIVAGNPDGDVRLVEFFDYNCPYCKRAMDSLERLMKDDPKLKVVLIDFPVLGPESVEASRYALAAKAQLKGDRYWDYHRRLMNSKGRIGKERAVAVAKEMGLDLARLEKDAAAPAVAAAMERAVRAGDALKLQGTPAFVVGDEIVFGAVGAPKLAELVGSVRKCGKATC